MLAQARPAPSSRQSPALSEASSSSLSDIEEMLEEQIMQVDKALKEETSKDLDTEAETERLHPTPNKHSRSAIESQSKDATLSSMPRRITRPSQHELNRSDALLSDPPDDEQLSDGFSAGTPITRSTMEVAGVKRKRSSSLSDASDTSHSLGAHNQASTQLLKDKANTHHGVVPVSSEEVQRKDQARPGEIAPEEDQQPSGGDDEDEEDISNGSRDQAEDASFFGDRQKQPLDEDTEMVQLPESPLAENTNALVDTVDEEDEAVAENEDEEDEATVKSKDERE